MFDPGGIFVCVFVLFVKLLKINGFDECFVLILTVLFVFSIVAFLHCR